MKARITQTDVARVAGVHNTTVSLSLKNSRLIPDATRKRIQEIAEAMGYCPDPALTALVAYRNSRRSKRQTETIAYITNWETKWGWRDQPSQGKYYFGAQQAAAEAGYHIEHFWLGENGMTQRRLSDVLLHRGISGALIASHRSVSDELSGIDWTRLSAVKIGCFPRLPALNQVTLDQSSVVALAIRHILSSGYRRVGLVIPQSWDQSVNQAWSKAFFAEQCLFAGKERLPILYLQDLKPEISAVGIRSVRSADTRAFAKWYHEHRPEVIVGMGPLVLPHLEHIGLLVPRDVSYVDLLLENSGNVAGVRQNCERAGELAVEMLAAQLQQNAFGIPAIPTVTSVGGEWVEGNSLATTGDPVGGMEASSPLEKTDLVA
jgi:LacI family transcriptional regulator